MLLHGLLDSSHSPAYEANMSAFQPMDLRFTRHGRFVVAMHVDFFFFSFYPPADGEK